MVVLGVARVVGKRRGRYDGGHRTHCWLIYSFERALSQFIDHRNKGDLTTMG